MSSLIEIEKPRINILNEIIPIPFKIMNEATE